MVRDDAKTGRSSGWESNIPLPRICWANTATTARVATMLYAKKSTIDATFDELALHKRLVMLARPALMVPASAPRRMSS